jgi:hypothetical protein
MLLLAISWSDATVLGAVFAALGFVGKLLVDELMQWRKTVRARQASLVRLQSLLLASRRVFELQAELRDRLCDELTATQRDLPATSYDEILSRGYARATEEQKLLHGLIRQYTISALKPLNRLMCDWLLADDYYKLANHKGDLAELALHLRTLDAHLILWLAKYDHWIPNHPEHALVYMADENMHGAGFPNGIDLLVGRLTGGTIKPSREPP